MSKFIGTTGLLGLLGVVLGAFGAHGLEERLIANGHLDDWGTATFYLFVHVLALFVLSICMRSYRSPVLKVIAWFWMGGIFIFSGSLYSLALTDISKLGIITPLGGVLFIAGWGCLAWAGFRNSMKSIEGS